MLTSDNTSVGDMSVSPAGGRCVVDGLPAEVLMRIFRLGQSISSAETVDYFDSESTLSSDTDPDELDLPWELLLSRICRRWRETALQTASLWSTVQFSEKPDLSKQIEYLKRSKNAPLDLVINLVGAEGRAEVTERAAAKLMTDILSLVLPLVERWRTFKFGVSVHKFMAKALKKLGQCPSAPLLETLFLHFEQRGDPYSLSTSSMSRPKLKKQDFVIFHGSVPNLNHLRLSGAFLDWPRYHGLPKLTKLDLMFQAPDVRPSYEDLARILRESPQLAHITFDRSGISGDPEDWDPSPITLPALKRLRFGRVRLAEAVALVQRWAMPSLDHLVLEFQAFCDPFLDAITSPNPITGFSILSKIETLEVYGMDCTKKALRKAYSAAVNLKQLELSMPELRSSWYRLLARQDETTGAVFCPKLEKLVIVGVKQFAVYFMLKERWTRSQSLKTLEMSAYGDELTQGREEWLREVLEELDIERMPAIFYRIRDYDEESQASDVTYYSTGEEDEDEDDFPGETWDHDSDGLDDSEDDLYFF